MQLFTPLYVTSHHFNICTFVKVSHNDPSQCVRGAGTGGGV